MGFVRHKGKDRNGKDIYLARYRGPDGRERSKQFRRKVDAENFLTTVGADKLRGLWIDPRLGRVTVAEWAERWIATKTSRAPKTVASYQTNLKARVLPAFGDVQLSRLDRVSIEEWVSELSAEGLSRDSLRQALQVLSSVLELAVSSDILPKNPAKGVKLPSAERREMHFLTSEQVSELANATPEPYSTLMHLLAYSGLRWGEAAALRKKRCDLLRNRLEIAESLSEVGGTLHFKATKNYEKRTVAIPEFVKDLLALQLAAQKGGPDSLVFTASEGGPLRHSNFYHRVWRPAVERVNVPEDLRIHDLRHTCAAFLISAGVDAQRIRRQLGHSSISVTFDVYGHLFPEDMDSVGKALESRHDQRALRVSKSS